MKSRKRTFLNAGLALLAFAPIGAGVSAERTDARKLALSGKLAARAPANIAAWDELVVSVPRDRDAEALKAILRIPAPENGIPAESYKADLFRILEANPGFFVSESVKAFGGNPDCVLRWLVFEHSQSVPYLALRSTLEEAVTRAPAGEGHEELDRFRKRAEEVFGAIREDEDVLSTQTCDPA